MYNVLQSLPSTIFAEIMEYVTPWYINEESQQTMMNVAKITAAVSHQAPTLNTVQSEIFTALNFRGKLQNRILTVSNFYSILAKYWSKNKTVLHIHYYVVGSFFMKFAKI